MFDKQQVERSNEEILIEMNSKKMGDLMGDNFILRNEKTNL